MLEGGFQQLLVTAAKVFKLPLEAALEAAEERLWSLSAMLVAAHDVHDQRRDERSGKQIAGQHGEAHSLSQRYEQEFRHARQEEHGHEHDADAERGDKGRPEEHTSELQSLRHLVCRLLLEKKKL